MAAKYESTYVLNITINQLVAAIRDPAFSSKLHIVMKSENPSPPGVWYRFHHGVTATSWGEKITISLYPVDNRVTQLKIHSECGMPTQVIDWGKNKQVVCNVYEYLAANAPRYPTEIVQQTTPQPQFQQVAPQPQFQQAAPQPQFQQAAPQPQFQQAAPQPQFQQAAPQPQFQQAAPQPQFQQAPLVCKACGKQLPDSNMKFCGYCGTKIQ